MLRIIQYLETKITSIVIIIIIIIIIIITSVTQEPKSGLGHLIVEVLDHTQVETHA